MRLPQAALVFRKELTEQLRDRRTLATMLFVSTLLFPLLTFGMGLAATRLVEKVQQASSTIMILGEEHALAAAAALRGAEGLEIVPPAPDFRARINHKKIRAAVEFPPAFAERLSAVGGDPPVVKMYYYLGELRSQFALRSVQTALNDYRDRIVRARLAALQLSPRLVQPFSTAEENVASPQKLSTEAMGRLLPMIALAIALLLPAHAAMDLTAGEKERGTMETILASPVGRAELAVGKFLVVLTTSAGCSLLSILSMSGVYLALLSLGWLTPSGSTSQVTASLSALSLLALMVLIVPMAAMASAAMLAIALLAKSLKEAQSYLQPLILVLVIPAMIGSLPGIELNTRLAAVPILNVVLAGREVIAGSYPWRPIAFIFLSSSLYAGAALALAAAAFKRESVLFSA